MKHYNSTQEHIANLQEQWLQSDHIAVESTANMLDDVIYSIFGDPARIGYELLQNADDASDQDGLNVDVEYILLDRHLVIQHNGLHFTPYDVDGLCRYGAMRMIEDEEAINNIKQFNANKIGYKGIGFKSVFNIADRVWIHTRPYTFKFDKPHWEKTGKRLPWQIVPIPYEAEELPKDIEPYLKANWVGFVLELKASNQELVKKRIATLFDKEEIILFLRHVRSVKMFLCNKSSSEVSLFRHISRSRENDLFRLKRYEKDGLKAESRWYLFSFTLPIDTETRESLVPLDKRQCPEKLKSAKETEITFGASVLEDDTIQPLRRPNLFSFLPTKTQYEFPFLVNGNFLMDESRTNLLNTKWNEFLFRQIGYCQLKWFEQMAKDERFKYEFAGLLIQYAEKTTTIRNQKLNEGLNAASREVAFVPILDSNKLKKAHETIVDQTAASTKLGDTDLVKQSFKEPREIADPKIKKIENLVKIGAEKFDREKLKDAIRQTNRYKNPEDNIRLIDFFFQHIAGIQDKTEQTAWNKVLTETPFLLDQEKALGCPNELYFPYDNIELPFDMDLRFLHDTIYSQGVAKDKKLETWLNRLGLVFPFPIEVIRRGIIPMVQENKVPPQWLIPLTRYLYRHSNSLIDSDFQGLKKLRIKAAGGDFLSVASAYLSTPYEPRLPLEEIIKKDIFISPEYMEIGDMPLEWNRFWSKIGVSQEMEIELHEIQGSLDQLKLDYSEYHDYLLAFLPDYNPKEPHRVVNFVIPRYIQYSKDHHFALKYWEIILKGKWRDVKTKCKKCIFMHSNGKAAIPSYFEFTIRANPYFPAKDGHCYTTEEVCSQDIGHLAEGLYPVSALPMTVEQEQFLGVKNKLILKECLELLQSLATEDNITTDKERITEIYHYVLNSRFDPQEIERHKEHIENLKLLAVNNTFQPAKSLVYLDVPKFAVKADEASFLYLDMPQEKAYQLCELFGIRIAGIEDFVLDYSLLESKENFRKEWELRIPLISALARYKAGRDELSLQKALWEQTRQTEIHSCSNIDLKLIQYDKAIYQHSVRAWSKHHSIYIAHPWNEAQTRFELAGVLTKFFGLEDVESELYLLLELTQEAGLTWLMKKGIDIPPIETESNNGDGDLPPKKENTQSPVKENNPEPLINTIIPLSQSPNIKVEEPSQEYEEISSTDAEIFGRQGEQYVFDNQVIQSHYEKRRVIIQAVEWVNQNEETQKPYDLKAILADGTEEYWEVKSTPSPDKNEFPISEQELRFAFEYREKYHLIRLLKVGNINPDILIFPKVIDSIELGEILIKDAILKIV